MATVNSDVPLRVLYTVNTSPQYILAKAPQRIPFRAVGGESSNSSSRHGCASVKACAMAICRSSPELRPDATKDFSIYILDPLEDMMSKSRHGQSSGVAVAMGLLSIILSPSTPDSVTVNGTFVPCGQNESALEVVVSLKQVAPSIMHSLDDPSHCVSGFSESKSTFTHSTHDQPCYTSSPRPLPSLDERLFAACNNLRQNTSQSSRLKEPRKPNPAHFTRAHQLPTPYIGPPKRKYTRDPTYLRCQTIYSGPQQNRSTISPDRGYSADLSEPGSSQLSVTSESGPSQIISTNGNPPNGTTDLSQAAVLLAALSAVSSRTQDGEVTNLVQTNTNPNPELVAFVRAYFALLNNQQGSAESSRESSSSLSTNQLQDLAASGPPIDRESADQRQDRSADKENQKPQSTAQGSKELNVGKRESSSPLGPSRFNASFPGKSAPSTGTLNVTTASGSKTSSDTCLDGPSRKRKLSDATQSQPNEQNRKRSTLASKEKGKPEDMSGIRVNSGWGGLRVRSDGSLWGEHLPRPSSSFLSSSSSVELSKTSSRPTVLFRSSSSAPSAPVRKGPYVVPDWAKGVPPPAPPRKETSEEERDQDRKKEKKRIKSKGLARLGGKGSVKRSASLSKLVDTATNPRCSPSRQVHNDASTKDDSRTPPKKTPRRPPIFAYSSPGEKSGFASLFQAFQTSPCRPASIRKNAFSTPLKPASTSPAYSAKFSSLFTPSPGTARSKSGFKPRRLFMEEDVPTSPTPTKKRNTSPRALIARVDANAICDPIPPIDPQDEEYSDSPSSLPIASSDDLTDRYTPAQLPSASSDSTITSLGRVHDWSSLDLPPSSPPPPSSPSIVPVYDSDLPCSDMPTSDLSEIESPPALLTIDISHHSTPSQDASRSKIPEALEDATGPIVAGQFSPFDTSGEEGPSAVAALEALNNGLGQENLSEVWNFLNSLCDQSLSDTDATGDGPLNLQDWLTLSSDPASEHQFDSSCTTDTEGVVEEIGTGLYCGGDPATSVATNFEDLLRGCVV